MVKLTVLVCLIMFIGVVYSACDSCGSECMSACGTRRFRACCFNYLRKKRAPDNDFWASIAEEPQAKAKIPAIFIQYVPENAVRNILENTLKTPDDILEQD